MNADSSERRRPARVVYIMGAGRSGSTALGIALGNLSSVFFAGDISAWVGFRGLPNSSKPAVQAFWKRVRKSTRDPETLLPLDFHGRLEHPRALLRPWSFFSRRRVHAHHECNAELFERILAESDAEVVVDSAHYPLRALRLRSNPDLEVSLLYLRRDPRHVVEALRKPVQRERPMPPLVANAYCLVVWVLASLVYWSTPRRRRLQVRHEDFAAAPASELGRIAAHFGIRDEPLDFGDLAVGPLFQGNRIMERDRIALRPQPPGRHLSPAWRWLTTLLQLPVLWSGGYLRDRSRGGMR